MKDEKAASLRVEEWAQLLKLGHCPYDIELEDEGDHLPEPHCHANREGDCDFAYCPQPVVHSAREEMRERAAQIVESRATIGANGIAAAIRKLPVSEQAPPSEQGLRDGVEALWNWCIENAVPPYGDVLLSISKRLNAMLAPSEQGSGKERSDGD